jgi:hypothetical protein
MPLHTPKRKGEAYSDALLSTSSTMNLQQVCKDLLCVNRLDDFIHANNGIAGYGASHGCKHWRQGRWTLGHARAARWKASPAPWSEEHSPWPAEPAPGRRARLDGVVRRLPRAAGAAAAGPPCPPGRGCAPAPRPPAVDPRLRSRPRLAKRGRRGREQLGRARARAYHGRAAAPALRHAQPPRPLPHRGRIRSTSVVARAGDGAPALSRGCARAPEGPRLLPRPGAAAPGSAQGRCRAGTPVPPRVPRGRASLHRAAEGPHAGAARTATGGCTHEPSREPRAAAWGRAPARRGGPRAAVSQGRRRL